jgi:ABC-type multidrug transport system fused ATPase/permease subunit
VILGEILIDDVPIEEYDIHHLRSRIVMVDQHTVLFNASIRDNIAYGVSRVRSDCHFRKTATEYDRKTGIKWLSCTEK